MKASNLLKAFIGTGLLSMLGDGMNSLVVAVNGGFMPVMANFCQGFGGEFIDGRHICGETGLTYLNWLSDFITIGHKIYSPGDLVLIAGVNALYLVTVISIVLWAVKLVKKA